jgi:hypothetical protein
MNKVIIGAIAVALSFGAAACSSSKSSSPTAATDAVATTSAGTTGGSTAGSSGSAAPLNTRQAAVLARTETQMTEQGLSYDETCVSNLIAQLSDADADLILAATPPATVTVSPAGEAIGEQLLSCTSPASSDTVTTTS